MYSDEIADTLCEGTLILVNCDKCNYNNVLREREAYLEVHALTTNRVNVTEYARANP